MEHQDERLIEMKKNVAEKITYDKMYFLDLGKMAKVMGKNSFLVVLGVALISILFSDIQWWAKGLFGLGAFLLVAFAYYDTKYMMGLKKNPFMIYPDKKTFRYYNEFKGNKEIDITQIQEIKVYTRAKETFLWEVFLRNQKQEENVNVSGFDSNTLNEMMNDLKTINPNFAISSNHEPKRKEKKK